MVQTHVNNFLASLNIPGIHHKTLKKREREAGVGIENVAKRLCVKALTEEQKLSSHENQVDISFDGAWQRRGSGKEYNSLSGHGAAIGEATGKIMGYAVRSKGCNICENGDMNTRKHDCRKNWTGSSKAMEGDIAVEVVKTINQTSAKTVYLTIHEDTTTIHKLRTEINQDIEKRPDMNHTKKGLGNMNFQKLTKY
uniref:Uncharacterized protein LOC102801212 n=1 Tax=Saccoglossus kowalevskii TaxID=10224 RepID=A0ABM0MP62_SACKO|nr:PREDICTED: uncharacterized protein LOC102801212 [Saccoglossus kowalevskii]